MFLTFSTFKEKKHFALEMSVFRCLCKFLKEGGATEQSTESTIPPPFLHLKLAYYYSYYFCFIHSHFFHKDYRLQFVYSIHPFSILLILHRVSGSLEPIPGKSAHKVEDTLEGVPTQYNPSQGTIPQTLTHPFAHYGKFGNASGAFGLGEGTRVPGENPWRMRRTRKVSAHRVEAGVQTPNPGGANLLTTKPLCPLRSLLSVHKLLNLHLINVPKVISKEVDLGKTAIRTRRKCRLHTQNLHLWYFSHSL